jgi:hypothetical protein
MLTLTYAQDPAHAHHAQHIQTSSTHLAPLLNYVKPGFIHELAGNIVELLGGANCGMAAVFAVGLALMVMPVVTSAFLNDEA